jgi:hypothetical protein
LPLVSGCFSTDTSTRAGQTSLAHTFP